MPDDNEEMVQMTLFEDPSQEDQEAKETEVVTEEELNSLKADILCHFKALDLPSMKNPNGSLTKEAIRSIHAFQRQEKLQREKKKLNRYIDYLLNHFANGDEVQPESIDPELILVSSTGKTGLLFRFASLIWSIPVSPGYGRRMRYLVRDRNNGKLIGLFAIGDPVFNLNARDKWIGWDVNDRRERLVHLMDAYVVGAVPPYSQLLGGKLIVSLIGSDEVSKDFEARYNNTKGIISGKKKAARLTLVTVSSALGRSSLYNRVKLVKNSDCDEDNQTLIELVRIGSTRGYGHFQLSNELFERVRDILRRKKHKYASGHQYGQGPNWRFRVMRVGLNLLELDRDLVRHGIQRDVYAMPMASDFREFLCGRISHIEIDRPTAATISKAALNRWVIPRSYRRPEYKTFKREQILEIMHWNSEP